MERLIFNKESLDNFLVLEEAYREEIKDLMDVNTMIKGLQYIEYGLRKFTDCSERDLTIFHSLFDHDELTVRVLKTRKLLIMIFEV